MELSYRPFDADNHYYETLDSFTRLPRQVDGSPRCADPPRRQTRYVVVGGKINRFIPNPDLRSRDRSGMAPS